MEASFLEVSSLELGSSHTSHEAPIILIGVVKVRLMGNYPPYPPTNSSAVKGFDSMQPQHPEALDLNWVALKERKVN